MKYFIIIRGPLGVGKSTIAQKLAKSLKAHYVPIDSVLEKYGLDKVRTEKWIPAKNFIKANEIILPDVKAKLKKGKIVIFDACFYHKKVIQHLKKSIKAPCYVFTLKAPLKVCIERDRKRKKKHGKWAAIAVHNLVSRFDYGIIINTKNKTANNVVKEIMLYLP